MAVSPQYIPDMRKCSVTAYSAYNAHLIHFSRSSSGKEDGNFREEDKGKIKRTESAALVLQRYDVFAVQLDVQLLHGRFRLPIISLSLFSVPHLHPEFAGVREFFLSIFVFYYRGLHYYCTRACAQPTKQTRRS